MFFFGIFGVSSAVKPAGTAAGVCPVCGGAVQFSLARSYSYFHFFFLPLFRFGIQYFATCPGCASVFEVPRQTGDDILHGRLSRLDASQLRLVKNSRAPGVCPRCGRSNPPGSGYCNGCGAPL